MRFRVAGSFHSIDHINLWRDDVDSFHFVPFFICLPRPRDHNTATQGNENESLPLDAIDATLVFVSLFACSPIYYGDRSFAVAGPRLWNSLPISLRKISSYGQFRRYLKNHLFGI